jgi:P4 family phage/plasmid primase-like protien
MRRTREKFYTHILVGNPYGTYGLSSHMEEFWELYLERVKKGATLYIAENPMPETPILVDIDISVPETLVDLENETHIYTKEQLQETISIYQTTLKEIIQDITEEALTCVVLEKPYYKRDINDTIYIKNGFHLHFPKLFLDKKSQEVYLIPIVKQKLKDVFANLTEEDVVDSNSVNVHWLMYGSKKPNCTPYVATAFYLDNCEEVDAETALGDYILKRVDNDQFINCEGKVIDLLPRILSTFLGDRIEYYYHTKPSIDTPLMKVYKQIKEKRREFDQRTVDEEMEEASQLINLLNPSRADDRADWLSVGFCLWNISKGDEDGLTLWLLFSEQSPKYDEAVCIYTWNGMKENKYTIGTLRYFAKLDNPEQYKILIEDKSKQLLHIALEGCHTDIARMLYNEYGNEFICSNKTWYQFKNHIWKDDNDGMNLRKRISSPNGVVIKQLTDCIVQLTEKMGEDGVNEKDYQPKLKRIADVMRSCKNAPFKTNVMIECREQFNAPDFNNLLNKDPNIIAFQNGVYDFTHDIFREGKPEDYLSIALPIDYVDYGSINNPAVIEVVDFFRKIFPDSSVREYFLEQTCQVFVGGNHDKVVLFWTGEGNNGKTITQTMFEKMLGKLAVKFNTTLITGKKIQTGAANPELARAGNGVRWAVMEEPNPDEMISAGTLKSLTGNDSFWARDLFEKGKSTKEIIPMFKFNIICNTLMHVKNPDPATWNRIRVIPFESTFVPENECPESFEEQMEKKVFPMDKHFADKIPNMLQPLAWFLIHKWRTCNRMEKYVPDKVKLATDNYRTDNDIYQQFENQCVFEKEGAKLSHVSLYAHFKEWYKEECPGHLPPNKSTVITKFSNKWGCEKKYWLGKTCTQPDEDDEDE